jgi:ABC-type bacteriocin/lantibiotic exporter with double-glycine peptidase domain
LIISFIWSWNITLVTSSLMHYVLVVLSVAVPLLVKGLTATAKADAESTAIASEALEGIRLVAACGAQGLITSLDRDRVQEAMRRAQTTASVVGAQFGLLVSSKNCTSVIQTNKLMQRAVLWRLWLTRPGLLVRYSTIRYRRNQ